MQIEKCKLWTKTTPFRLHFSLCVVQFSFFIPRPPPLRHLPSDRKVKSKTRHIALTLPMEPAAVPFCNLMRDEQAEAEVGAVTEGERPANGFRKRDAKGVARTVAAIAAAVVADGLELQ